MLVAVSACCCGLFRLYSEALKPTSVLAPGIIEIRVPRTLGKAISLHSVVEAILARRLFLANASIERGSANLDLGAPYVFGTR